MLIYSISDQRGLFVDKLKIENKYVIFKKGEDLQDYLRKMVIWIEKFYADIVTRVNRNVGLDGSATWDPGLIASGDKETKEVTVTNAVLGDFAMASFSLDVEDLTLNADVTDDDTVTCVLANNTGGAINLESGTLRARVIKR